LFGWDQFNKSFKAQQELRRSSCQANVPIASSSTPFCRPWLLFSDVKAAKNQKSNLQTHQKCANPLKPQFIDREKIV
jgi:hypothetical protein